MRIHEEMDNQLICFIKTPLQLYIIHFENHHICPIKDLSRITYQLNDMCKLNASIKSYYSKGFSFNHICFIQSNMSYSIKDLKGIIYPRIDILESNTLNKLYNIIGFKKLTNQLESRYISKLDTFGVYT